MEQAKRGRPHKWNPQIIAGWRYANGKSIAETAKKWMVSADTVKRACRDHGDGALLARQAWITTRWLLLHDRLDVLVDKHGGYLPVFINLIRRIKILEAAQLKTERAMDARGIAYTPSSIYKPVEPPAIMVEARKWEKALGIGQDEDDPFESGGEWNLSFDQERSLGW